MSVLIKGIEMPVFEHQSWDIRRGADGKWYVIDTNAETSDGAWHEIVPVLSHGRLIDADALEAHGDCLSRLHIDFDAPAGHQVWRECVSFDDIPTVIPAEEEKNTNTWPEYRTWVLGTQKEIKEKICLNCFWYESEEQYCFRKGCHSCDNGSCELWKSNAEPQKEGEE